jgi:hypothetical protein
MPVLVQMESGKERCVACGLRMGLPYHLHHDLSGRRSTRSNVTPRFSTSICRAACFAGCAKRPALKRLIVMSREVEIATYRAAGSLWHKADLLVPQDRLKTREPTSAR